jgi:hypothetical protein
MDGSTESERCLQIKWSERRSLPMLSSLGRGALRLTHCSGEILCWLSAWGWHPSRRRSGRKASVQRFSSWECVWGETMPAGLLCMPRHGLSICCRSIPMTVLAPKNCSSLPPRSNPEGDSELYFGGEGAFRASFDFFWDRWSSNTLALRFSARLQACQSPKTRFQIDDATNLTVNTV